MCPTTPLFSVSIYNLCACSKNSMQSIKLVCRWCGGHMSCQEQYFCLMIKGNKVCLIAKREISELHPVFVCTMLVCAIKMQNIKLKVVVQVVWWSHVLPGAIFLFNGRKESVFNCKQGIVRIWPLGKPFITLQSDAFWSLDILQVKIYCICCFISKI